nr:hypothetical protein [Tanacetum cinerariifolium]
ISVDPLEITMKWCNHSLKRFFKLNQNRYVLGPRPFTVPRDKGPGLDGFTFKLIKKHWTILGNDVISFVKDFHHSVHIPRGCNSSFITLVSKVEDPIVIGDFRPISLIGCQYKILAKVLANRLALVIPSVVEETQMAFIKGYASILINGSPTKEFKIERGLRQDDPLSPFLFILAMKVLNVAILKAQALDIFRAAEVGIDKVPISHLLFVDDALIIGKRYTFNVQNLSRILTCFNLASCLKVNFNKSKLFSLGVPFNEVCSVASLIGCQPAQLPCIYLGLPIGANM